MKKIGIQLTLKNESNIPVINSAMKFYIKLKIIFKNEDDGLDVFTSSLLLKRFLKNNFPTIEKFKKSLLVAYVLGDI